MNISFDDLINKIKDYNPEEVEMITNAYKYAKDMHDGQLRESGEPYIMHPLNVAYILADMKADRNTVCAGLLHDVIEDTSATKEDIANLFNPEIAELVDGVTKLAKMNFTSKESQELANTRKIINGLTNDVRIIIIKLADRLHNMRTLQFKNVYKQRENSMETMNIFVPLAYYIGAYRIKTELEDLALKYSFPDDYRRIELQKMMIEEETNDCLITMHNTLKGELADKNIPNEIKVRIKNIYGIYKKLKEDGNLSDLNDLLALKIVVNNDDNCYRSLGVVHKIYHPVNGTIRDYICTPKANMYQSLHTTVFAPDNRLVHTQIRTTDMDKIASFGLTAYWDINKGEARNKMQEEIRSQYRFCNSLEAINELSGDDNKAFMERINNDLFADKIYVYTSTGERIDLPKGSTAIDFAYAIDENLGNTMIGVQINGENKPPKSVLYNNDRVVIITNNYSKGPDENWLDAVKTTHARRKIIEFKARR